MTQKPDLAALFAATSADTFPGLETCKYFAAIDAFIGAPCATPYGSVGACAQNGPSIAVTGQGAVPKFGPLQSLQRNCLTSPCNKFERFNH